MLQPQLRVSAASTTSAELANCSEEGPHAGCFVLDTAYKPLTVYRMGVSLNSLLHLGPRQVSNDTVSRQQTDLD